MAGAAQAREPETRGRLIEAAISCILERGFYRATGDVADQLLPLAGARLVIDNEFRADLEPELWAGDEHTAEISAAAARSRPRSASLRRSRALLARAQHIGTKNNSPKRAEREQMARRLLYPVVAISSSV